jgi:hypothetical protein
MSNLPFTNSLVQYYTQLKDNKLSDELEIISVDINDSMNVAYSKYYLDFPWIITDISNLLLRQQLVENYFKHEGLVVPCLIILNSSGKVYDQQGTVVIDAIINRDSNTPLGGSDDNEIAAAVQTLTQYYHLHPPAPARKVNRVHSGRNGETKEGDDYELYTSYQVNETIPTLSQEEKENGSHRLKILNRRSVSPQRLDSQDHQGDDKHKSLLEKISSFSFYDKDEEKNRDAPTTETLKPAVKSSSSIEHDPKVRFITVEKEEQSSIPFSALKQQLLLLPTLASITRHSNKELELLRSLFQARTETEQIDLIIGDLQEQRQFSRLQLLSRFSSGTPVVTSHEANTADHSVFHRERITTLKDKCVFYERIISTLTYNDSFPALNIGFPNQRWEKDFCKVLSLANSDWESELISYGVLIDPACDKKQLEMDKQVQEKRNLIELYTSYEELVRYYTIELDKYAVELLRFCQIARIYRLATARVCEFICILLSVTLCICIPVVVGVVIAVYKR